MVKISFAILLGAASSGLIGFNRLGNNRYSHRMGRFRSIGKGKTAAATLQILKWYVDNGRTFAVSEQKEVFDQVFKKNDEKPKLRQRSRLASYRRQMSI